jgi:hypothetical protein
MLPGARRDRLWNSARDAMDALDEPLRISIELDRGAEPLAGRITVPGTPPRAFVGWMELVHAIDSARLAWDGRGSGGAGD